MSQNFIRPLIFALVCVLGCDDNANSVRSDYGTRTVEDGLLFVPVSAIDDTDAKALVLDVTSDDPKLSAYPLPGGGVTALQRPDSAGREVVLLTAGLPAVLSGKDKRAALNSHVLVFGRTGELMRLALKGRYRNLSLSPDGRYGIAFGSSSLSLENAVEVIDFTAKTTTFVDLSLDARAPTSFLFAPVNSFKRRLVVAPQPNALQVLDLEHPELGPISITLDQASTLNPAQVLFSGDRIFVRCSNSPLIITLQSIDVPSGNSHGWQLAPGLLTASSVVRDIAVTGEDAKLRLLALTGSLEVFDPDIGLTAKIDGLGNFSQILQFTGVSPIDRNPLPRAMLYGTQVADSGRSSVSSSQVAFVDLGDESAWSTRNVERVELGDTVISLKPLATKTMAVASHSSARASVIDLESRKVRRVVLDGFNGELMLDETPARRRLWARGPDGRQLGMIDLDGFASTEVPIAFGPSGTDQRGGDSPRAETFGAGERSLLLVPSPTRRRVAVLQNARTGHVTFIDAEAPVVETALEVLGVFLPELLD